MRDLARAILIALCFFLLAAPAISGSSAFAFAMATALLAAANLSLLAGSSSPGPAGAPRERRGASFAAGLAFAGAGGLLVFVACRAWLHEMLIYPNDSLRADMLIVIQQGVRRMLQGRNPYTSYHVPWDATLPYGPVMWAPYILPYLARADVRFVSLLGALFVPVLCAIAASGLAAARRYAPSAALLIVVAAIAFSPDLRGFASIAHTPSYWPLLALLAWFVSRERWHAAAVTAGLLIVARTTMIAVAPVLMIAVWQRERTRIASVSFLLAAAAILPYLPFAIWDPKALAFALYGSYQLLMKGFVWTQTTWAQHTIGITGLLLRGGLQRFVEVVQIVALLVVYASAWRSIRAGRRPLPWMAAALFVFSLTTFWPVHYIYFDVFLLWACALAVETPWPAGGAVWPAWCASLAATVAIVAGVTWLEVPRDPSIDVGTGAARALLYRGFSTDERDDRTFAWIDGTEAEVLVARRSRSDAAITIEMLPHLPRPGSAQSVSVALNGTVLDTVPLRAGWNTVTFEAPGKAWVVGVNAVTLALSSAESPRASGTGDDDRRLSAAVDRLTVRTKR